MEVRAIGYAMMIIAIMAYHDIDWNSNGEAYRRLVLCDRAQTAAAVLDQRFCTEKKTDLGLD